MFQYTGWSISNSLQDSYICSFPGLISFESQRLSSAEIAHLSGVSLPHKKVDRL